MSERDDDYAPWLVVGLLAVVIFIAVSIMTTEYRSQIRDLQRRVDQLEQQVRQ